VFVILRALPHLVRQPGLELLAWSMNPSLSARPKAMAWDEERQSGRRSYVVRASLPLCTRSQPRVT
jgi:hypothetical protein